MENKNIQNSLCRKSVEDLMHEQAKEIANLPNGRVSYYDVYSSFVKIANAASKYATEQAIKQIEEQINNQSYGDYKIQLNIIK